jgi:CTP:molybdopterin cytidylyltransferase MocA
MTASVAAIILAAGASRRLGTPKQLIPYQGTTLLERAVDCARRAGTSPILVVLGANADAILETCSLEGSIVVQNQDWSFGMASSLQTGIQALERHAPGIAATLVLTCDQPALTVEHLKELVRTALIDNQPCASQYAGRNGVPAVFPSAFFPSLSSLQGDAGARSLLARPGVHAIPFPGGELDIDSPADLERLRTL